MQPPEVFYEKGFLRNFTKFTGKQHLCQILFFNKDTLAKFIIKETLAQVFFCKFYEISKNTFLQNTSGRLLLKHWKSLTKIDQTKKLPFSLKFLEVHLLLRKKSKTKSTKLFKIHHWNDKSQSGDIWNSLFTEDSGFDPLISKLTRIINQRRRDKMRQL